MSYYDDDPNDPKHKSSPAVVFFTIGGVIFLIWALIFGAWLLK